jgi:osmotically-inducible protein OsmY
MRDDHRNEALAVLAGIGIGATLMYFLDPQRGNARRTQAIDQTGGMLRSTRRDLEIARRELRNRARGAAAELRGRLRDEYLDDERIEERVRAQAGHRIDSSMRGVEVEAVGGTVILRGQVAPADHQDLVEAAREVRGVHEVRDELSDRQP